MKKQLPLLKQEGKDAVFEFPELKDPHIALDTETTGVSHTDTPVGLSVASPQGSWYLPFAHELGTNLDLDKVKEWCKGELRNKSIVMHNAKFDIRMLRKIDVDLEELNVKPHDTQHPAALLDSKRKSYSLEDLGQEHLGVGKVQLPGKTPIHLRDSADVAEYAKQDASLTYDLCDYFGEFIASEQLDAVLELEDDIIYAVLHMEDNGARIDTDLLNQWDMSSQSRYVKNVLKIYEKVQFRVEPSKPKDLMRLYNYLDVPYDYTEEGRPSFTRENMKKALSHEEIKWALDARDIFSIRSKFIAKYKRNLREGHLFYNLNQLKADEYGTVTGRFSSSGERGTGINIQQVFKEGNLEEAVRDYQVRKLFIPDDGFVWFSVDAAQIEFRIFAHYANSERLNEAYRKDPRIDFHTIVASMIDKPRYETKRINFGSLYGMGIEKLSYNLGTTYELAEKLSKEYHKKFPEARQLLKQAARVAEERGYVKTILGRRRRYDGHEKTHSALNAVIQGTAADIMKEGIRRVYNKRREIGIHKLRFTIHDELDGDVIDKSAAMKIREVLEEPYFGLRIPILWDIGIGPNWNDVEDL